MNVFIMHVGRANSIDIDYTISRTRTIQEVTDHLSAEAPEKSFFESAILHSCFPNNEFNCWGVPIGAQPSFEKTKVGDLVLFIPEIGIDGGVEYFGLVKAICPIRCYDASYILWPKTPTGRPFPWLFFFDTEYGHVPWNVFLSELKYAPNWNPRGWYRRVSTDKFVEWGGGNGYAEHLRRNFGFVPLTISSDSVHHPHQKKIIAEAAEEYNLPESVESEIIESVEAIEIVTDKSKATSSQGFQSNPKIRRAIELKAMTTAREHFQNLGWNVRDVSQRESYDLQCTRDEAEWHVEVKGTTSNGNQILLTPLEMLHAKNYPNTALFILYNLQINDIEGEPEVIGGESRLLMPWLLNDNDLKVIGYICRVPES